jgi:hypothetical protein
MRIRQVTTLLRLAFFTASLAGCDKTSAQEKKGKENFRKGSFHPTPRKNFGIGPQQTLAKENTK